MTPERELLIRRTWAKVRHRVDWSATGTSLTVLLPPTADRLRAELPIIGSRSPCDSVQFHLEPAPQRDDGTSGLLRVCSEGLALEEIGADPEPEPETASDREALVGSIDERIRCMLSKQNDRYTYDQAYRDGAGRDRSSLSLFRGFYDTRAIAEAIVDGLPRGSVAGVRGQPASPDRLKEAHEILDQATDWLDDQNLSSWPDWGQSALTWLGLAPAPPIPEEPRVELRVREGAYYADGAGRRIGPMYRSGGVWYQRDGRGDWNDRGVHLHGLPAAHPHARDWDLVAEWVDPAPAEEEPARRPTPTLERELAEMRASRDWYRQRVVWVFLEDGEPRYYQGEDGEHEVCDPVTAVGLSRLTERLVRSELGPAVPAALLTDEVLARVLCAARDVNPDSPRRLYQGSHAEFALAHCQPDLEHMRAILVAALAGTGDPT